MTSVATALPFPIIDAPSLSRRLLGLDWRSVLPWHFGDLTVEPGSYARDAAPFMTSHYAELFATDDRFLREPATEAKRRFGAEMDVLVVTRASRVVGLLVGHPMDWSTYYWRSIALLPEARERRLLARIMEASYAPLREAGVARVEGECSPTNAPMMRALSKLGWVVTSMTNSERWGATVRFTKFLQDEAEKTFGRQFCGVRADDERP